MFHAHLDCFFENLGGVSKEKGEHFHQNIKEIERQYQGQWNINMIGGHCSILHHENLDSSTRGKTTDPALHEQKKSHYAACN